MFKKKAGVASDNQVVLVMTLPAIILMIAFVAIPLVMGLQISFTNWNGYSQGSTYVGLSNYSKLFGDPMFLRAFRNTIIYGFGSTLFQTILGVLYALLLQRAFALRGLARTIIYLPAMIAQLLVGYVWYFMVEYNRGALNDIVKLLGMAKIDWLGQGDRAVIIIMIINTLNFCGKAMIIYIAGLNSIPDMYYEAASVDGATAWQQFWHITMPQLIPAITTSTLLNLIGGLKMFGLVISTTGGGPGYSTHSLSSLINTLYFSYEDAGYASAVGVFTFVFIMAVSILIRWYLAKKEAAAQ